MHLPKNILVPTDFSECGREAIDYASALAKKFSARVYVLHAWVKPARDTSGSWAMPGDYRGELEAAARGQLDLIVDDLQSEIGDARALFYVGDPRDSILKAAHEVNADMIVMGTHGRGGLSRALMGSVADAVVRRADCPVMTVRHAHADDAPGRTATASTDESLR